MQRKAYVTGTATLLAALLTGCTSGSGSDGASDNANPDNAGTAAAAAQPGRYNTLPEPCRAVSHDTLDSLLPGITQITDPEQRDKAYRGEAALTYDTDRKVGCRWKVESADATDRLSVDLERVVSYDDAVSDDDTAKQLFAQKEAAADLPQPSSSPAAAGSQSPLPGSSPTSTSTPADSTSDTPSASVSGPPADLESRTLSDLGDEAYIDDQRSTSGSTAEQRTVTVVFRTSNVVVTIVYAEQPMAAGTVPDSKEMQDRALDLASRLDGALGG